MFSSEIDPAANPPMYDFSVLRQLRKREGWTLEQVSNQSGVSSAVISKLERNQSTAELDTLYRVARVFGLSATELIALAESPLAHKTSARSYQTGDFHFKRVDYRNHRCFMAKARAGATASRAEIHVDDYETCWVIDGQLRLTLPHQSIVLNSGEAIQFDAAQEHGYEALSDLTMILLHLRKGLRF